MQFWILGPLEVLEDDGRPLALGGAKQRALLAVLLLHAGQVVSTDRLIDELWGEEPPETARNVLQVYVANLRKVLEPGRPKRTASTLLKTQPPGYLLDLGPHGFDLAHFEQLVTQGRDLLAADDPQTAAIALRRALELWRGPVLGDVAAELTNQGVLARLEEQRLAALEQRIDADLALGRHSELVGELEALVTAHPLRERLRGQLMVALYRCGRQAEALEAYRQTRETLAEELGIDPSRALQDLERAILAQNPALDWMPPAIADAAILPQTPGPTSVTQPSRSADLAPKPKERALVATRRTMTVLCLGITASRDDDDIDPELRDHLASSYADTLQAVVEGHGGTILESTDEGVIVVYGVPTLHENDALRAVRAAAEARNVVARVATELASTWGVRVALSAGIQTSTAVIELEEGQRPSLAGAPVRLARQLEQACAPGEILLDTATCGLVRDAVRVEQARPLVVRGRGQPVAAWRLVTVRLAASGRAWRLDTPMVGRSRQLAQLTGAFEATVADQACQLVTVLGSPGVGKSRLVYEFLNTVGERATVLSGRCPDYGEGISFWALSEILKAEARILESDGPSEAEAKLAYVIEAVEADPAEQQWLKAWVGSLVGLGNPEPTATTERAEAFAAWRRFLEAVAARRPLVLVIEDLHWADEALVAFLTHLAEWATDVPLLVVCTARPELYERAPGWGGGLRNVTTISLAPLSEADTAQLLATLTDQRLLPADLQALLLNRAGGNPLYMEEFVRLLADRGLLERHEPNLWLAEDAEVLLPATVQALIAARLDSLALNDMALLQDASVIGQTFWSGALAAMSDREEAAVRQRLHELTRRELLRPARRSTLAGQAEYAFRHVLVREVAYSQIPKAARARKHVAAATWIEQLARQRVADHAEILAHHYRAALQFAQTAGQDTAGLIDRARVAFRTAGDQALDLNAFATAARWYAAALELWPAADTDRPGLMLRLGRARAYGEQAGGDLLAQARDGLLAVGDQGLAAEAEVLLGLLALWRGEGARSITHGRQAAKLLERQGPSHIKANVLANLAGFLVSSGQPEEAIQVGRQALAMAERLGLDEVRMQALDFVGCARGQRGDPDGAADLDRAAALAVEANSPHSAVAFGNLASVLISLGDLARGFEAQAKGREAAERFGLAGELRWFRAEHLLEDYWRGRWDAATRTADEIIAESEEGSRHFMEDACRLVRASIRFARSDVTGALHDTQVGLELARAADNPQALYPALAGRARILLAAGRAEEASARASELLALLVEQTTLATDPDWSGQLAIVLHALRRGAELVEFTASVRATRWLQAASAMAGGEFERAADLYADIGSLPDEGFARLQAAKQLLAADLSTEANAQLNHALAFFREVRASACLIEGKALLAASA